MYTRHPSSTRLDGPVEMPARSHRRDLEWDYRQAGAGQAEEAAASHAPALRELPVAPVAPARAGRAGERHGLDGPESVPAPGEAIGKTCGEKSRGKDLGAAER
jgi:hypothetical protein